MIKTFTWLFLLLFSLNINAQYKPDVIIMGGSAAGTAAAIQAARSGVKALLIEPSYNLIGELNPNMDIPSVDMSLWKEWRDAFYKANDSSRTTPQVVLENIVKNTKNLQFLKETIIQEIKEKNNGWELQVLINGKPEKIKCKVLLDAGTNSKASLLQKNGILKLDSAGKYISLVNYDKAQQNTPYQQLQKLYRTSAASGFGKDSIRHYIPLGVFIPQEKDNLLLVSMSSFKDFDTEDLRNIALWVNMGQAAGALAAYGPFFDVSPSKANIRLTQGEMFTYKSFLYAVQDIQKSDFAWTPVQKIIASGILLLDFKTGFFNPTEIVNTKDIKGVLAELYPRSRIWFIENKTEQLSVAQLVSLISFITGRDPISIQQEIEADWVNKYQFTSTYSQEKNISKIELACLFDNYITPFNVNVDFNGYFLR
ncbi:FAD-dependent oxidoreductase [Pedobacter alpinus]|uniref:FAD-dependent oxidoreductase n=1 Tax=Pedobacter alpinus TaxID=1590643 RepID=A0ABW5TVW7_9SPHI